MYECIVVMGQIPYIGRRKAIKSIGAGSILASNNYSAEATGNGAKYDGLAYDPATHEIFGEASGQFNQMHGDFRGNLNLPNEKINMNKLRKFDQSSVEEYQSTVYKHFEQSDDNPVKFIRVNVLHNALCGYVQKSDNKTGFSLVPLKERNGELEKFIKSTRLIKEKSDE